jgi:hypothetical protein
VVSRILAPARAMPKFQSAVASNVALREHDIGSTLSIMFKSDHPSIILLAVNAQAYR